MRSFGHAAKLFPVFLVMSCLASQETPRRGTGAITAVDAVARTNPALAGIVAPNEAAFRREEGGGAGAFVSAGWRSTKTTALGARAPETAEGTLELGAPHSPARFGVTLVGARASTSTLERGRVVYEEALLATDRVLAATEGVVEELLVLRDARAPRSFAYRVDVPDAVKRAVVREGAVAFLDAHDRAVLTMARPSAWDAANRDVPVEVRWDEDAHAIRLALTGEDMRYPVVVDPKYETGSWFDGGRFWPAARGSHAMAFDAARGVAVLFGGYTTGYAGDTWTWDGSEWTLRAPATSPSARAEHAMVYDTVRREIVLFGGRGPVTSLADTWTWNGATWTKRTPATSPPARYQFAMAFDEMRGEAVLFGGDDPLGVRLSDTWTWDGTTWSARASSTIGQREGASLAYDAARNEVVLFGGFGDAGLPNDTWIWTGSWTRRALAGPPGRSRGAMAFDATRNEVVLTGGNGGTWTWNGTSWSQRETTSATQQRSTLSLIAHRGTGELLAFGGTVGPVTNDFYGWNGTSGTWTTKGPPAIPSTRYDVDLAYDAIRNEVVLFAGFTDATNDTWVWNGKKWARRIPATSPSGRFGHRMAFDADRGEIVMFGGYTGASSLNDTWRWNGTTWTRALPATSPPGRYDASLTYDSARHETVLFGGQGSVLLNDTWAWNGTSWTQRSPSASPAARAAHVAAFDAVRGRLVLFGGAGASSSQLGDTWTWDGTTWSLAMPAVSPPARRLAGAAFDESRGEMVVFAGENNAVAQNDLWFWNGTTWTTRVPVNPPPARRGPGVAYDRARNNVVAFGGYGYTLNDTWLYQTLGGTCTQNTDCLGASCVDGVCCSASACDTCETCAGTSPGRCTPVLNESDPDSCPAGQGKSCSRLGECKSALGVQATSASDCASGFLADGVCCDEPCDGRCKACRADLKDNGASSGKCDFAKSGLDPHDSCPTDARETCQKDGTCNGRGECALYASGAACGAIACVDNRATGRVCDGLGACGQTAAGVACDAYACNETEGCRTACTTNADCSALHHCEAGKCVADRGATCVDASHVVDATGVVSDCAPYKCQGATCLLACANRNDCVGDADCTEDKRCVAFVRQDTSAGATGGCHASSAARGSPFAATALVSLVLVFRRRARRSATRR